MSIPKPVLHVPLTDFNLVESQSIKDLWVKLSGSILPIITVLNQFQSFIYEL